MLVFLLSVEKLITSEIACYYFRANCCFLSLGFYVKSLPKLCGTKR